jgi:hypothetical protein
MEFPRLLFKDGAEVSVASAAEYEEKLGDGWTDPAAKDEAKADETKDDPPAKSGTGTYSGRKR